MRITDFIHKTTAFTLAEMMVILTVMSVVMAATMPIITAPDSAMLGGTVSDDNLWIKGNNFKSISTANFVAVGMAPDVNTPSTGTASLFINNRANELNQSHILFTVSPDGKKVYNAGRLYMGALSHGSEGYNIAIGANALSDFSFLVPIGNINTDTKSIAIGDWSMRRGSQMDRISSVAIGSQSAYANALQNSVAIGYGALSSASTGATTQSVGIGYLAGRMQDGDIKRSTYVGYLAGYNDIKKHTSNDNTYIGYQAGALATGDNNVNIGYLAGFYSNSNFSGTVKNPTSNSVNIGVNAGAMPLDIEYNSSWNRSYSNHHVAIGDHALYAPTTGVSDVVAIGSYSGYKLTNDNKGSIFIGTNSGADVARNCVTSANVVNIGTYSGYNEVGSSVAIGYYAGGITSNMKKVYCSSPIKSDKFLNDVVIGYNAGSKSVKTNSTSTATLSYVYGNIMIGNESGSKANTEGVDSKLVHSICIGRKSCTNIGGPPTAGQSLFIGKYASINLSTYKTSMPSFSIITFEWPGVSKLSSGAQVVIDTTSGSYIKGQMIIAPISVSPYFNYKSSKIIFDATNLYGPASKPTSLSDITLKENIKPLKYSLKDLKNVNVYEYNYADEKDVRRIGVIAQDLLNIMPEGVDTSKKESYSINPDWLFYAVLNAVKELDKTVDSCKNSLVAYAKEYQTLSTKIKTLEKEQKQLEKERKSLERQINKAYKKAEKMEKSA